MNETQVKFTEELAEKIKGAFATPEFLKSMKDLQEGVEAGDTGTFKMIISTDNEDRHGEIIDQNGWEFENYMRNPVVLWGHNSYEIPVGITDKIYIELDETGVFRRTIAEGRFASHEFAQTLRKLYDEKMLRTSSVGFLPKEYNGNRIIKAELLEWSFVSIPANQYAVSLNEIAGYSRAFLVEKGIIATEKKEGDVVETPAEEEKPEEVVPPVEAETVTEPTAPAQEETVVEPAEEKKEEGPTDEDLQAIEEEGEVDDIVIDDTEKNITINTGKKIFKFKLTDSFADVLAGKVDQKAGRVISSKNLTKIKDAITALQEVVAIAEPSDEEDKANDDVSPKGSEAEIKEAKDFLKNRKTLQALNTVLSEVLGEMKQVRKSKV